MHIPVMKNEVLEHLDGKNIIDCTFGLGGHSKLFLERGANVLAFEADPVLYAEFQKKGSQEFDKLILVNESYSNLQRVVEEKEFKPDGILMDLGMSTWHIKESGRGFSFQKDEPLDMRFNPEDNPLTAYEIVNGCSLEELERILKEYGEEDTRIAKKIVERRPITTTYDLVEVIWSALPRGYKKKKIHPATKTFQALRIRVNSEIENIKQGLLQAVDVLEKDGKLVVISFHAVEDREVKRFFRRGKELNIFEVLTKKPLIPTQEEIRENPSSRSAKLRVIKKIV